MKRTSSLAVILLISLSASASARRMKVPVMDSPQEKRDPDFRGSPSQHDLLSLIKFLGDCIAEKQLFQNDVPGVDLFLSRLEYQLRYGSDLPRDRIIRNASGAREVLRIAYNGLADAQATPRLAKTRDELAEVAEELKGLLEQNRRSVYTLQDTAAAGRETASAMVVSPPDSPGSYVPLEDLQRIRSLESELRRLQDRLKPMAKRFEKIKAMVETAKFRSGTVASLADKAAQLDSDALSHLSKRRTSGIPARYRTTMQSREVILNANKWLEESVKRSEKVIELMEKQLDPEQDGLRKSVDEALVANGRTIEGRERQRQSGKRINFNHGRRMNIEIEGVIRRGWEVANSKRKQWWVGRAQMAKSEALEDAGKMENAHRKADQQAQETEQLAQTAYDLMDRIDEALGETREKSKKLAKRPLRIPDVDEPDGEPIQATSKVKSKPLKIPKTFQVTDDEIIQSYD